MNSVQTSVPTLERVLSNQDTVTKLTNGQVDLLIRVALGKTNAQIAQDLHLQEQTIKNRLNTLMKKLRVDNRVHIATFACLGYPPSENQLRIRWNDQNGRTASS